jgi:hypothetical protein
MIKNTAHAKRQEGLPMLTMVKAKLLTLLPYVEKVTSPCKMWSGNIKGSRNEVSFRSYKLELAIRKVERQP